MHKFLSVVSVGFIAVLLFAGCDRNGNGPSTPRSTGDFSARVNNSLKTGHKFKAFYYAGYHQLFVVAQDADWNNKFQMYIVVDSVNPLQNYPFNPNGTNNAEILPDSKHSYYSDINDNSLSGNVQLLKFDTVTGKVSGTFAFKAYNYTRKEYIDVTEGRFEDIELDTVKYQFPGSYLECDVNGSVKYFTPDTYGRIEAVSGATGPTVTIYAVAGEFGHSSFFDWKVATADRAARSLEFDIPLSKGTGTFALTPNVWPYSYQWDTYHLNEYILRNENPYLPVSGSITITHLDTANRKLSATFQMQAKDSTNKTVSFSNGKIELKTWSSMQ